MLRQFDDNPPLELNWLSVFGLSKEKRRGFQGSGCSYCTDVGVNFSLIEGVTKIASCANSMACCGEKKFTCFGSFCQIGREENEIRILEAWNNENLKASHKGKIY